MVPRSWSSFRSLAIDVSRLLTYTGQQEEADGSCYQPQLRDGTVLSTSCTGLANPAPKAILVLKWPPLEFSPKVHRQIRQSVAFWD